MESKKEPKVHFKSVLKEDTICNDMCNDNCRDNCKNTCKETCKNTCNCENSEEDTEDDTEDDTEEDTDSDSEISDNERTLKILTVLCKNQLKLTSALMQYMEYNRS